MQYFVNVGLYSATTRCCNNPGFFKCERPQEDLGPRVRVESSGARRSTRRETSPELTGRRSACVIHAFQINDLQGRALSRRICSTSSGVDLHVESCGAVPFRSGSAQRAQEQLDIQSCGFRRSGRRATQFSCMPKRRSLGWRQSNPSRTSEKQR